jgi:hypothetical protein
VRDLGTDCQGHKTSLLSTQFAWIVARSHGEI